MPEIGQLLARWRTLGVTAYQVAQETGLDWRTVRNVQMHAQPPPRRTTLILIDLYLSELEAGR